MNYNESRMLGMLAPPPTAAPQRFTPDGRELRDDQAWDADFARFPEYRGIIPRTWLQFNEAARQLRLLEERERERATDARCRAERERQEALEAEEWERTRPRTAEERIEALEARCTALEATIARLTTPARVHQSRAATRSKRGSGDVPPCAA